MPLSPFSSITSFHALAWALPHSGMEWGVIGLVALLIFGKRLPGAAKGIGQGIMEFKRGMRGATEEAMAEPAQIADQAALKPRFDPATGKPLAQ
jgi:TatA/E family protein of Tat protein translocase